MVHPILCKLLKISPNLRCSSWSTQAPVDYPLCLKEILQKVRIFSMQLKKFGVATVPSKELTVNSLGKKKKII